VTLNNGGGTPSTQVRAVVVLKSCFLIQSDDAN